VPASGLNHVSVSFDSLEESIAFYEELFGAELIPTPNFGFPVQWLRVGGQQLHLFERPEPSSTYHHFAISVAVEEFEAVYAKARDRGAFDQTTYGHHLNELPGDCAQLYLRDPAGNLVEVDALGASRLPDSVRRDIRPLADRQPQDEQNLRATLFLEPAEVSGERSP
jgi:catechol 2,3-dioxygenase-like lactoylglutathione lyase family enzyme